MSTDQGVAPDSSAADEERSKQKRRAFLAVGLVVGLGVGATLAVFSTNVFGTASFQTQDWGVQAAYPTNGTCDGATGWVDPDVANDTATGALNFQLPLPNIVPDVPVYAPLCVRTHPDKGTWASTLGFEGVAKDSGSGGAAANGAELYSALELTIANQNNCPADGTGFGTAISGWPSAASFTVATMQSGSEIPVDKDETIQTNLCLKVELPAESDTQNTRGALVNVTFKFLATAVIT